MNNDSLRSDSESQLKWPSGTPPFRWEAHLCSGGPRQLRLVDPGVLVLAEDDKGGGVGPNRRVVAGPGEHLGGGVHPPPLAGPLQDLRAAEILTPVLFMMIHPKDRATNKKYPRYVHVPTHDLVRLPASLPAAENGGG